MLVEYQLGELAKLVKGHLIAPQKEASIRYLLLDSRKLVYPEGSLFVALVTPNRDGHQFIEELYEKGVRCFMISKAIPFSNYPDGHFIEVKDTLSSLHALVAAHRRRFDIPVIGITGSNGKTIVKEWLFQLLHEDYSIVRSPKSYNSQIGVPLSVWNMEPSNTLAIFEAGISQPGEMVNLEKIIHPTIGIFTNIGEAHNEGFLNIRQKINEKLVLFTHAQVLIYCKDYPELNENILLFHNLLRKKENEEEKTLQLFSWSRKSEADLRITGIERLHHGSRINANFQGRPIYIKIPFIDEGSIENAIHCWVLMLWLKIGESEICRRMETLSHVAMRLELKQAINNCSLINDSYNSDLGSLTIALDFLQQQKQHPKHTIILSDILQSGRRESELYEEVATLLEQKKISRLFGIGKSISREKRLFQEIRGLECHFYPSTEEFIQHFHTLDFQNETILLKGARIFEFERVGKLLEQKIHQTVLEFNLSAMIENLKQYQKLLKPQTKVMVMVKAFSYGSGSFEIANQLQFHKVNYLAVAYADEGVDLRKNGITLPIMVMNPEPSTFDAILQWNLEPEIYSPEQLQIFEAELSRRSINQFPIHIKLDTGMHRLGFEEQHLDGLTDKLTSSPHLKVISVFSHLAASEDPGQREFTRQQAKRFDEMCKRLQKVIPYPFMRHLANSSAITDYPELHYDMVRLGIGLYGIDNTRHMQENLRTVSVLKTTVSQVKHVRAGETVGYGRAGKVGSGKTIATVSIGYADGYFRSLGNGKGFMSIHGVLCPVIGQVCMDMLMLDVSELSDIKEGDEVIVFGNNPTLVDLASWADTIPYEIMTRISQRVRRIYFQE